jgi:hypothetical protein
VAPHITERCIAAGRQDLPPGPSTSSRFKVYTGFSLKMSGRRVQFAQQLLALSDLLPCRANFVNVTIVGKINVDCPQ